MARETTYTGMLGDWLRILKPLQENAAEVPHLEGPRLKLEVLLNRAQDIVKQQAALKASKQETSRELRAVTDEGQRLVNMLRVALKEHYGPRAEKLAEYSMQPFRGRTRRQKPLPPPEDSGASS
jgi:hypothetical protein